MPRAKRSPHSHGRSEIWERAAATQAISTARREVGSRLRALRESRALSQEAAAERIGIHAKHLQRMEGGSANATLGTLVAVAVAYRVPLADLFALGGTRPTRTPVEPLPREPFERLEASVARPFENCVPLYPLKIAAGAFAASPGTWEPPEPEAWVSISGRTRPRPGLFVAQVFGESMNRRIPSGAYCLFRAPVEGSRNGRVVLVQHRNLRDPDHGGHHTVKIWRSKRVAHPDGSWRHTRIQLVPDSFSRDYRPIPLRPDQEGEILVIAELIEVLPAPAS